MLNRNFIEATGDADGVFEMVFASLTVPLLLQIESLFFFVSNFSVLGTRPDSYVSDDHAC